MATIQQPITDPFQKIKALVADIEADVAKFDVKGNKAAGTRVRGVMQQLKALAQDVRVRVVQK